MEFELYNVQNTAIHFIRKYAVICYGERIGYALWLHWPYAHVISFVFLHIKRTNGCWGILFEYFRFCICLITHTHTHEQTIANNRIHCIASLASHCRIRCMAFICPRSKYLIWLEIYNQWRHDPNIFAMAFSHSNCLSHIFCRRFIHRKYFDICMCENLGKPLCFFVPSFSLYIFYNIDLGTHSIVCIMVSIWNFIFNFLVCSSSAVFPCQAITKKNELYVCIFCSSNKVIVRKNMLHIHWIEALCVCLCAWNFFFAIFFGFFSVCVHFSLFDRIPTKWILNVIDEGENVLVPHCHIENGI